MRVKVVTLTYGSFSYGCVFGFLNYPLFIKYRGAKVCKLFYKMANL